ncbi:serine protease, partial [Rhodococcus opacus]
MATETLADVGLVRFSMGTRPVGAGFIVDDQHIVTCAHVVNASLGRALIAAERPDTVGPVTALVDREWIPVEVEVVAEGWIPLTEDKRGDVAVLKMIAGRPEGVSAVPLRRPHQTEDRRFAVQGFPDGTLIGATGVIRTQLTIGQEWIQLEDDKQAGRAVTEGFSGAPIWDTTLKAVVGMAIAKDARVPAAKIAAMLPVTLLARYWPPVADLLPSRLALDPKFDTYWDPRARGVETRHVPGSFFTGRRRALTELVEWLVADPHPADNLRVVSGGPGSGKSGVLARLVTRSDPGFRRHHPISADDPVCELLAGAVEVAVHARGMDPTQILQALAAGVDSDATDVEAIVAALAAHGRPVTCVVDGLDESTDPRQAAGMLRRLAGDTADLGVRLLASTRPGPQMKLLQALGASAARNSINLDDTTYLDKADLAEYVRRRLLFEGVPPDRIPAHDTPYRGHDRLAERVAARVAGRAYPSFLIAALTAVGLVRRGKVVNVDEDGWDQFPATVADAMDDYLDRFDEDRDRVEEMLRPLAYSYGDGLPPDELWAGLATGLTGPGRTYTVEDIGWLLRAAADYLLEATVQSGGSTAYRLYHQALIEHLREQDRSRGLAVAEQAYRQLLDSAPRSPHGGLVWQHAHPYLLTHLADHAGATAGTGHLRDLVDDPCFLLAANPTTLTATLRRSRLTSAAARTYRMAAHLLADPSDRLLQMQLHAARLGETTLERKLAALAERTTPRLAWTREPRYTPHYTLGRHTGWVAAVAVAEVDGRPVVVSGGADSTVRVWDLATGDPLGDP